MNSNQYLQYEALILFISCTSRDFTLPYICSSRKTFCFFHLLLLLPVLPPPHICSLALFVLKPGSDSFSLYLSMATERLQCHTQKCRITTSPPDRAERTMYSEISNGNLGWVMNKPICPFQTECKWHVSATPFRRFLRKSLSVHEIYL